MKKKASMFSNIMLVILVLAVLTIGGSVTNWYGLGPAETAGTGDPNAGDQGTLKYLTELTSEDTPVQFAGSGYCWDQSTPKELIGGRGATTLSATAGTTFSPAFRGKSYECTAFSTSQYCDHKDGKMVDEGLQLKSDCQNITGTSEVFVSFSERDTEETTNSLTISAGTSKCYNKWYMEVNTSNKRWKQKAVCFGSNASDSNVADITVNGFTKDVEPESLAGTADDFCFALADAVVLDEGDSNTFGSICIEADADGFSTNEQLTVTLLDEGEYIHDDGDIKSDWFARGTDSEADVGGSNPTTTITLVS